MIIKLQLEWQEDSASIPRRARGRGHDRTRIRHSALTHQLQQYQPLPWHTDIERQVEHLNEHVIDVLHNNCPVAKRGPKKSHITDDIWQMRADKLHQQRKVRQLRYQLAQEHLHRCFAAWREHLGDQEQQASQHFTATVRRQCVHRSIRLWQITRALRKALSQAKRHAVQKAIGELPTDSAASQILYALKPVIGPTNPKLRKATPLPQVLQADGTPCDSPESLRDRWTGFLEPWKVERDCQCLIFEIYGYSSCTTLCRASCTCRPLTCRHSQTLKRHFVESRTTKLWEKITFHLNYATTSLCPWQGGRTANF